MSKPKRFKKKEWFKDYSVKRTGGGPPPPNHPRRCQARNSLGLQCGRWALRGRDYCAMHGGRTPLSRKKLANYYSKHAGRSLKSLLEEVASQPDDERLSLAEEIDVARINTARALQFFEKIVLNEDFRDKDGNQVEIGPEKMLQLKSTCSNAVKQGLDQVASLVQAMAKVEALKQDKISVHNIKWIVARIMRLIEEEVEPVNSECAKRLCNRISDLKLLEGDSTNAKVVLSI